MIRKERILETEIIEQEYKAHKAHRVRLEQQVLKEFKGYKVFRAQQE
jgi:hypothetical protein